ncbi:MAG: hemolysin family protein [Planctomycetota bacterium]
MYITLGLVLLGLTLYFSTLSFTLHTFSRARLVEHLTNGARERWLGWLDEHEWELQRLTGVLRLALNTAVFVVVLFWQAHLGLFWQTPLGVSPQGRVDADLQPQVLILGALLAVLLLAVFSIAVPHALAVHGGEAILARSLPILAALRWLLWPAARLFDAVEFVIRRLLGKAEMSPAAASERVEQEILDAVSEGEAHGAVAEDKVDMIESVFELDETQVSAIMTPRTEIDAVPVDATYEIVRDKIVASGHSRLPVYEKSIDHIIGVVYAKDLLKLHFHNPPCGDSAAGPDHSQTADKSARPAESSHVRPAAPFDLRNVMRAAPYVPETKTLDELLAEFRQTRVQIAIVLDEYGGTAGLATLEDILEELVGEIDDEYDQPPPPAVNRLDDQTLEVDARVRISEINEELETELSEEEDYETIGGYVFATLGKIPAAGEEFERDGVHVRITDAEPRRIKRLQIKALHRAETT